MATDVVGVVVVVVVVVVGKNPKANSVLDSGSSQAGSRQARIQGLELEFRQPGIPR